MTDMSVHPKHPRDLALAPVAVEINQNLQPLRDRASKDVEAGLQLILDTLGHPGTREGRAQRIQEVALQNVDAHGWDAKITEDGTSLRLTGGSVRLDIGLGRSIQTYIEGVHA